MKSGGKMAISIMFIVSFVMLVAAVFTYMRAENNDFAQFSNSAQAIERQSQAINKKLDEIREENKKLREYVEVVHSQADSAKSKAETAEALAHKVAVDAGKKIQGQAMQPIKFEPIRVIFYDKRDLQNKTKSVKPAQQPKGGAGAITETKEPTRN